VVQEVAQIRTQQDFKKAKVATKQEKFYAKVNQEVVQQVVSVSSPSGDTPVCLNADGVRLWNEANEGPPEDPATSIDEVPHTP
jgi:hypothetical protein